jgi:hypothetical protein
MMRPKTAWLWIWLCRGFGRQIFVKADYVEKSKHWVETRAWFFRGVTLVVMTSAKVTEMGDHVVDGRTRLMWNHSEHVLFDIEGAHSKMLLMVGGT